MPKFNIEESRWEMKMWRDQRHLSAGQKPVPNMLFMTYTHGDKVAKADSKSSFKKQKSTNL